MIALACMTAMVLYVVADAENMRHQRDALQRSYTEATERPIPTVTSTVTAPPVTLPPKTVEVTVRVTERADRSQVARAPARATSSALGSTWDRLAQCESGGNWQINTGNGYGGGLQFSLRYWPFMANLADVNARYPWQATKAEQIAVAEVILSRQGWQAWPACSRKLGLR